MTQEQFELAIHAIENYRDGANFLSQEWERLNNIIGPLRDLYESSQWKPISEAPRDEHILLANSDTVTSGCFSYVHEEFIGGAIEARVPSQLFTHYRPLPKPPKEVE